MTDISNLPAKTPISLLQEVCARRGITPKYDLLSIEGAVHEPTFVFRVTVGELVYNGTGQSKKKAKHAAAKTVLDKLIGQTPEVNGENAAGDCPQKSPFPKVNPAQIISPYDDGIPGNPVGALQELCMSRRLPPPLYELVTEQGLPHERNFVMSVTVIKIKETGVGKSKKLAKRQGAHKLLQHLKDLIGKNEPSIDEDDRYASLLSAKIPTLTPDVSQKVGQFHRNLKNSTGKNLEALQKTVLNKADINFTKLLQEIAREQNFEVTYVEVDDLNFAGKNQCLVQLSTLPVAVCYGSGDSANDAKISAAHNALEYLKIMTRK